MARPVAHHLSPGETNAWRATLCGLCASLVGIGLARFAYTPLLPAIIGAGWFGAANLAGYLAGAPLAAPAASRVPARMLLRGAMVMVSISCPAARCTARAESALSKKGKDNQDECESSGPSSGLV